MHQHCAGAVCSEDQLSKLRIERPVFLLPSVSVARPRQIFPPRLASCPVAGIYSLRSFCDTVTL